MNTESYLTHNLTHPRLNQTTDVYSTTTEFLTTKENFLDDIALLGRDGTNISII